MAADVMSNSTFGPVEPAKPRKRKKAQADPVVEQPAVPEDTPDAGDDGAAGDDAGEPSEDS